MFTSNLFLCFWSRAHTSCTMLVTLSICGFQCDKTQLYFRVDVLSCCFLVNSSFIFLPSPVLHCITFHEKAEGNELWPEGSITITASLPLKGRAKKKKAQWDNQSSQQFSFLSLGNWKCSASVAISCSFMALWPHAIYLSGTFCVNNFINKSKFEK